VRVEFEITEEQMAMFRRVQELEGCTNLSEAFAAMLPCYLDKHDPLRKAERAKPRHSPREESKSIPAAVKHKVYLRGKAHHRMWHRRN
jgi:hypothetical protein